jgi:hypothetical protein
MLLKIGVRVMNRYLVTFFKNVSSSDGHIFKCPQQRIEIRHARSVDRALRAAERRYERLCKLADWKLHADTREVEVDGDRVDHQEAATKPTER